MPDLSRILQIRECVIDCSDVSNILAMYDDSAPQTTVVVGFCGSPRTIQLVCEDHESAILVVAAIRQRMELD